jgi:hypothetical protein
MKTARNARRGEGVRIHCANPNIACGNHRRASLTLPRPARSHPACASRSPHTGDASSREPGPLALQVARGRSGRGRALLDDLGVRVAAVRRRALLLRRHSARTPTGPLHRARSGKGTDVLAASRARRVCSGPPPEPVGAYGLIGMGAPRRPSTPHRDLLLPSCRHHLPV